MRAKIIFGTMGCGKTQSLIFDVHNLCVRSAFVTYQKLIHVEQVKDTMDTRSNSFICGTQCIVFDDTKSLMAIIIPDDIKLLAVDECHLYNDFKQFLIKILDHQNLEMVEFSGLLNDYKMEPYSWISSVLTYFDVVKLSKRRKICDICDICIATENPRISSKNDKMLLNKKEYISTCYDCGLEVMSNRS